MEKKCQVFSYAADTSILCNYRDYDSAYNDLLSAARTMIQYWYKMNYMQANPGKFQFVNIDKERQPRTIESQCHHLISIKCKIIGGKYRY